MTLKTGRYLLSGIFCVIFFLGACSKSKLNIHQERSLRRLQSQFGLKSDGNAVIIRVSKQELYLAKGMGIIKTYPVSTSIYGIGNKAGSNKTPIGVHRIAKKIGRNTPIGMIFESRRKTGKIAKIETREIDEEENIVTTRIMWLTGLEPGINKSKEVDSFYRYIYIHGTPYEGMIGKPASHGCIRMKNSDVIELFDLVSKDTLVEIIP